MHGTHSCEQDYKIKYMCDGHTDEISESMRAAQMYVCRTRDSENIRGPGLNPILLPVPFMASLQKKCHNHPLYRQIEDLLKK